MFDDFTDESRVWVFAARDRLSTDTAEKFSALFAPFVADWKAHEVPVRGDFNIVHDLFLLVCADGKAAVPTGCSIDGLFKAVRAASTESGANFDVRPEIYFRNGENICCVTSQEFKKLCSQGKISPDTIVFNNSITKLSDLKNNRWETELKNSWHYKKFGKLIEGADGDKNRPNL
ncbi:MAG: hypothetical protein D6719_00360 [Candidatus Dadabacteria bacterium]|nr:MAG: hypothetical protein D6719_00360 [Candidatus Dadabacteria bacterium]